MVISGALLSITLLLVSFLSFGSTLTASSDESLALKEAAQIQEDQRRDHITITSTSTSNTATSTDITVGVANEGAIGVARFSQMDVLVDYPSTSGSQVSRKLAYVSSSPGDNQWTVSSISPDTFHPNMWDPDETATLSLRLVPQVQSGATGTVTVVTPSGGKAESIFTN